MNFYNKDINDWIVDAVNLSMLEEGAYTRMVDHYFRTEQPLPLEESKLFRMVRAHSETEREAVRSVLSEFFIKTSHGFVSDKLEAMKEKIYAKSQKARESISNRWAMQRAREQSFDTNVSENHTNVLISDTNEPFFDTKEKEKEKEKEKTTSSATASLVSQSNDDQLELVPVSSDEVSAKPKKPSGERFQEFWSAYPSSKRKGAKGKCLEVWIRKKLDQSADLILAHLKSKDKDFTKDNAQYCPAPLVYLNGESWDGFEIDWSKGTSNHPDAFWDGVNIPEAGLYSRVSTEPE